MVVTLNIPQKTVLNCTCQYLQHVLQILLSFAKIMSSTSIMEIVLFKYN